MSPAKKDKTTVSGLRVKAGLTPKLKPTPKPTPRLGGASGTNRRRGQTARPGAGVTDTKSKVASKLPTGGQQASHKKGGGAKKAASKARLVAVTASKAVKKPGLADVEALAKQAIEVALDKKALLPVLIDVSAMASYTDFIGVVSGRSDRQVDAIADAVAQFMKAHGRTIVGQEGNGSSRWILLDFGDIVMHVFYHPVREFYDLESLWIDAPRVALQIPTEAAMIQPDALYM